MLKLLLILMLSFSPAASSSRPQRYNSSDSQHGSSAFNQTLKQIAGKSLSSIDGALASDGLLEDGGDLVITKSGTIEVLLKGGSLNFGICDKDCKGEVFVCYDAVVGKISYDAVSPPCGSSQCYFQAKMDATRYWFMKKESLKYPEMECGSTPMKYDRTVLFKYEWLSCDPMIGENGYVKLNVIVADPSCPLRIKHAIIKNDNVTIPTSLTSSLPSIVMHSTTENTEGAQTLWIVLGIVLGIIGLSIIIAIIIIVWKCCIKRRSGIDPKKVVAVPQQENEVPKSKEEAHVSQEVLAAETEPEKAVATTKYEPKVSKKQSKIEQPKEPMPSMEPTSTIEAPPQPSAEPTAHEKPTILNKVAYPEPTRLIVKSEHSTKRDSLEGIPMKNMLVLVESPPSSLSRFGRLGKEDYDIIQKMERRYPHHARRENYDREINLFCVSISAMYEELNKIATEAVEILDRVGVYFNDKREIRYMPRPGLHYLRSPVVSVSLSYFAFGAEYYQYVGADFELIAKFSIPLLYVIALQPRFSEFNRMKACTWIRRQAAKVRKAYTPVQREVMPFPINILEKAYEKNPKYFDDLDALNTVSDTKPSPAKEVTKKPTPAAAIDHHEKSKKKVKSKNSKKKRSASKKNQQ